MNKSILSRRKILGTGACALAAATIAPPNSSANAKGGLSPKDEETIRAWYAAWETRDWRPVDRLLADNFTFTSAAGDDHISKSAFKTQCWETQIDFIARFNLQHVFGIHNEALVMYVCRTKNGNSFRNVEYLQLSDGRIRAIECYFGAQSSFPSAVSAG